ncbi:MAG: hypothetical protein ACPGGB_07770 [Flavobacteriales bacterium]
MRTLLFSLLGSILLMGCAAEKRLGESRIEARRYSKGVHVQHHRSHHPSPTKKDEGHRSRWERPVIMPTEPQAIEFPVESRSELSVSAVTGHHPDTPGQPADTRLRAHAPSSMRAMARRTQGQVPQPKQPVLLETEALPEPINGYHPNAVPGFILSMGWALGIIGELAIQYLQMPLSGVAIALGILASIAGYALSRRAYRASLAHPELYPRYRLPRAARFVSIGFLAPIVLYVGLVLLIFLFVGGFGLL